MKKIILAILCFLPAVSYANPPVEIFDPPKDEWLKVKTQDGKIRDCFIQYGSITKATTIFCVNLPARKFNGNTEEDQLLEEDNNEDFPSDGKPRNDQ